MISANGGMGNYLGGGGGGDASPSSIRSECLLWACLRLWRRRLRWGGAGTIYTKAGNQSTGLVTLDNGGQSGTNTSWTTSSGTVDLTVQGGAVFAPAYYFAPDHWHLAGGLQRVAGPGQQPGISAPILTVDWQRHRPGWGRHHRLTAPVPREAQGTGAGKYSAQESGYASSGGGYGGYGAASGGVKPAPGGNTYDLLTAPPAWAAAAEPYSTYVVGGAGGANIRLNVTGTLQVDGRISAGGHGRG